MHSHPLIRSLENHDQLSGAEIQVLLEGLAPEQELLAGEDMVCEGDRPWRSIVLTEGFAARYKVQDDGTRQIAALHIAGDFVDLHSFLLKTMDHSVMALSRCKIAPVSHDVLMKISTDHPHLTRLLWLSTAIDGAIHRQWLVQMGSKKAHSRMAHLICEMFVRLDGMGLAKDRRFDFPITQAEFGEMLGLSNVHVNRTVGQLRDDGLIEWSGKSITIQAWDRLKEAAGFDPTYLNLQAEPR